MTALATEIEFEMNDIIKFRSRSGCLTCRARRVKWPGDETRPVCKACGKKNRPCQWEEPHAKFNNYRPGEPSSSKSATGDIEDESKTEDAMEVDGVGGVEREEEIVRADSTSERGRSRATSPRDVRKNSRADGAPEGPSTSISSPTAHLSPGSPYYVSRPKSNTGGVSVASLLQSHDAEGVPESTLPTHSRTSMQQEVLHTRNPADVPEDTRGHLSVPISLMHEEAVKDAIAAAAYQRCIALLIERLNEDAASHDETLLCAIVILRFYEQLNVPSSTGSDEEQHLAGCSAIIRSSQGHHFVDPSAPTLREAAFWVYVRQCLYNATINQQPPDIDFSLQLHPTPGSMQDAHPLARLRLETAWSNQMTWNLARVVNFCFDGNESHGERSYKMRRWQELWDLVQTWAQDRPAGFNAIFEGPADDHGTFPDIWFTADWHAVSFGFYHFACIMLLRYRPGPKFAIRNVGSLSDTDYSGDRPEHMQHYSHGYSHTAKSVTTSLSRPGSCPERIPFAQIVSKCPSSARDRPSPADNEDSGPIHIIITVAGYLTLPCKHAHYAPPYARRPDESNTRDMTRTGQLRNSSAFLAYRRTRPRMRPNDSATDHGKLLPNAKGAMCSLQDTLNIQALGVCSGSGLTQLDCALVNYWQASPHAALCLKVVKVRTWVILILVVNGKQHGSIPTSTVLRNYLLTSLHEIERNPSEVTRLNALLCHMFSEGIRAFCQNHNIPLASIDFVGTHIPCLRQFGIPEMDDLSTNHLGWNAKLAAEINVNTVFDFAVMEAGHFTPRASPVAFVNTLYLRHFYKFRACLTIGELANCNFIPPWSNEGALDIGRRDCGPGSLLIDYAVQYCTSNNHQHDYEGKFAAEGKPHEALVRRFLETNDYSRKLPSPNIARQMFGDHEAQRLIDECLLLRLSDADTIATATRITAENILIQYRRLLTSNFPTGQEVDELFISGPSARNPNIVDYLEAELPESVITRPLDDIGIPGDANEAVCYAHLAMEAVSAQPISLSTAFALPQVQPGHDVVLGRVTRGKNWEALSVQLQEFSQGKPRRLSTDVRIAGGLNPRSDELGIS
ncbi:c6 zinc finger-like protein [Stemphylium lycopersici]|nr:c6 zinc finger-like protein [Stemphylium lycopersici]